jgi:hypothetical protein
MLFVVKRILLMRRINFLQDSQQIKFVFCSSQARVEYPMRFFLKLSLILPGRVESGNFFLSILNASIFIG